MLIVPVYISRKIEEYQDLFTDYYASIVQLKMASKFHVHSTNLISMVVINGKKALSK